MRSAGIRGAAATSAGPASAPHSDSLLSVETVLQPTAAWRRDSLPSLWGVPEPGPSRAGRCGASLFSCLAPASARDGGRRVTSRGRGAGAGPTVGLLQGDDRPGGGGGGGTQTQPAVVRQLPLRSDRSRRAPVAAPPPVAGSRARRRCPAGRGEVVK